MSLSIQTNLDPTAATWSIRDLLALPLDLARLDETGASDEYCTPGHRAGLALDLLLLELTDGRIGDVLAA